MSNNINDVFGATPKTVLNKPFMQVQYRLPNNTNGGASSTGWNDRPLNTIISNDISGATLQNNTIVLPAGTYHIVASCSWYAVGGAAELNTSFCTVKDLDDNILVRGVNDSSAVAQYSSAPLRCSGSFTLNTPKAIKVVTWQYANYSIGLGGRSAETTLEEIYADVQIHKLDTSIDTPVVTDTAMTLSRPLFHAQDQKGTGVDAGDSVAGANIRDLNTTLINEIPSASLSGNEVTLPAGTYEVKARAPFVAATSEQGAQLVIKRGSDDVIVLKGSTWVNNATATSVVTSGYVEVHGRFTLTATDTIYASTTLSQGPVTNGLGRAAGLAVEIYTDLKIWQLDALRQTPVLVNDKLYPLPGNTMVTGNMHGLEYAKTGDNEVTVQPGICMDSTNTEVLDLPTQQAVTIGTTINQIYNLFLCDDQVVRTDTDVNGVNLGAYSIRWIGFVLNDASGVIRPFLMSGNRYDFVSSANFAVITGLQATYAVVNMGLVSPSSRVSGIFFVPYGDGGNASTIYLSYDGVIAAASMSAQYGTISNSTWAATAANTLVWDMVSYDGLIYAKTAGGTPGLKVKSLILAR